MEQNIKNKLSVVAAVVLSTIALTAFIVKTSLIGENSGPLILFSIVIFVLAPFRHESLFVRRLMLLSSLLFVLWLLSDLGILLLPFIISFLLAYLLDPVVHRMGKWKIKRSFAAPSLVLLLVGAVVLISVFVFPSVFQQLNEVLKRISSMVQSSAAYLDSKQFYRTLGEWGISPEMARDVFQQQIIPRLESASQLILHGILSVLTSISSVAALPLNVILIPLLAFYFLNDLPRLKALIKNSLGKRNARLVTDLTRINSIFRAYIGGQIISASFVGVFATILFLLFDIPYAFVLGVLCGLLNPIPYVGILASLFVAIVTILIVNIEKSVIQIIEVAVIVNVLHLIATYIIDPRVTGSRIGLHPVVLIASLFVFGHFFVFIGLIVAVPVTAVLMMYFNDWQLGRQHSLSQSNNVASQEA